MAALTCGCGKSGLVCVRTLSGCRYFMAGVERQVARLNMPRTGGKRRA